MTPATYCSPPISYKFARFGGATKGVAVTKGFTHAISSDLACRHRDAFGHALLCAGSARSKKLRSKRGLGPQGRRLHETPVGGTAVSSNGALHHLCRARHRMGGQGGLCPGPRRFRRIAAGQSKE